MDFKNFKGSPDDFYHKIKTDPEWFYQFCLLGGFVFSVNGNTLAVSPAYAIDDEMADLIRTHKADLIQFVKTQLFESEAAA